MVTKLPNKYLLIFIIMVATMKWTNAQPHEKNQPVSSAGISLNSGRSVVWRLYFGEQNDAAPMIPEELRTSKHRSIAAQVPGNVELDLLNAGIIRDPMIGNNVYDLRKYEMFQWWYQTTFQKPEIPDNHRVELCFDGIDCIADIWLNGQKIGHTDNMFIPHRFDITDLLENENVLYVCIFSPVLEGRKYPREHFGVRYDALAEAVNIRKAAHMYGWDILPRLISAGLWKDVHLEIIPPTQFRSVYWVTKCVDPEKKTASMYVDWDFVTDHLNIDDLMLTIGLQRGESVIYDQSLRLYTTVSRQRMYDLQAVDLWWPRGYGEPALYDATLQITDAGGNILAVNRQRIGIRTAELLRSEANTKDHPGEFVFKINNEKIFVRGTNWVPLDALHSRDKQHIKKSVEMLIDLNCNMVRMWGGNVYEQDEFYDLCDENGIMVWQDFAMACTTYPQDESFAKRIEVEAAAVIKRLRHHPALVLWAGNNENDISLEWAWDQLYLDPNSDIISRRILPDMVRRLDPKTAYLPSSPYISPESYKLAGKTDPRFAAHPGKIDQNFAPEQHLWGPRGYYKAPYYTENTAKFVSEIGYHGCPNRESLEKMMDQDFVYPWIKDFIWNDQWQTKACRSHPYSTETIKRNDLMINQIREVFAEVPTDLDRFIQASQIIQAEAMKYFIEFWRMNKFDRNGILWWNLRDGWPVISDAVVDYYYSKKLAYHYIKRVQMDVCVMIGDAQAEGHPVIIVNDTRNNVQGSYSIRDADTDKSLMSKSFIVGKNGKSVEGYLPESLETRLWMIEWHLDDKIYTNHYFAYRPQVELDQYLKWLPKLKP